MATESRWRTRARQIIERVIADNPEMEREALRALISAAYPFGERKYAPYKIWLNEVRSLIGKAKCISRKKAFAIPRELNPEWKPLLLKIAENYTESGPREVFADWLEERGHRLAEYIRSVGRGDMAIISRIRDWYDDLCGSTISASYIQGYLSRKTLIVDPTLLKAIECERNERVFKMVRAMR